MDELGLSEDNVIWKLNIPEDESTYDAIIDCIDQGCQIVFTNSYGHQSYALQAAEENPDVEIVAVTGDNAAVADLPNFANSSIRIYEGRYVAGIAAGMKLKELDEAGKLTEDNYDADGKVKIGYVGAFPYAEVISGYTAFFLGIRSVYENVAMEVQYTNSWGDITAEKEAAIALISDGCVIIGQHANTTGAPTACQEAQESGKVVYNVGYNVDMISVAPDAALVSPFNVWGVYYKYALESAMNGKEIAMNWAEGYNMDAVDMTPLSDNCAEGTQEAMDEAIAGLKDGSLHVFETSTFTVNGEHLDSYMANVLPDDNYEGDTEAISDGYFHEAEYRACPYFDILIDGITQLN